MLIIDKTSCNLLYLYLNIKQKIEILKYCASQFWQTTKIIVYGMHFWLIGGWGRFCLFLKRDLIYHYRMLNFLSMQTHFSKQTYPPIHQIEIPLLIQSKQAQQNFNADLFLVSIASKNFFDEQCMPDYFLILSWRF